MLKIPSISLVAAVLALPLVSCNWVDSAGGGDIVAAQPDPVPVIEVFQDDQPLNDQSQNNAYALNEKSLARIRTSLAPGGAGELKFNWTAEPVEQGKLTSCSVASALGFQMELAAQSLNEACLDPNQCALEFVKNTSQPDQAEFDLQIPALKASVGLRYQLAIEDEAGKIVVSDYNFCLIAVNEGPIANADTFVVTDGATLTVTTNDVNLLTNDTDDIDVSNGVLQISPEAITPPASADFFELGTDGSFTYQSTFRGLREDQLDGFKYSLSDGITAPSTGQVTIRVVASNQAPVQLEEIPALNTIESEPIEFDVAQYFVDPEGGGISFSIAANSVIPPSGSLSLSSAGLFSGTPTAEDVGSYLITLLASDGSLFTEATLSLEIAAAPLVQINRAPLYVDFSVFDQNALTNFPIDPVSPQFVDPDGDLLRYTMAGTRVLPIGVTINSLTGEISGTPLFAVQANNLRVRATDPSGDSALSARFYIRVR